MHDRQRLHTEHGRTNALMLGMPVGPETTSAGSFSPQDAACFRHVISHVAHGLIEAFRSRRLDASALYQLLSEAMVWGFGHTVDSVE